MIVHSTEPLNAEPTLEALRRSFITPLELFYIRSHGPLPVTAVADFELQIGGNVRNARAYSLVDLQTRFAVVSVTAVIQCAGNRRAGLASVEAVEGNPWDAGAIGNAVWTGVRLSDVLHDAGITDDPSLHVEFTSLDELFAQDERANYAVSIPIQKALAPEVLLSWDMNGAPLTPEHGFPLRAIVPGFAGVRSAKWLHAIDVRTTPSQGQMQARDYKLFPASVRAENADWSQAPSINQLPLTAAICEPNSHAVLPPGPCLVRGYAIASGSTAVSRVEVSADNGDTWQQAQLQSDPSTPWSWTLWQITLDLPSGEHMLTVRAWDETGQTQPSLPATSWNFKGYVNTSWHRVPVTVRSSLR